MNIKNFGTIFIYMSGEYIKSNSMLFLAKFKKKLDPAKVWKSLKKMILENSSLQLKFSWQDEKKTFTWQHFNEKEIKELLAIEKEHIMRPRTMDDIYREFYPTNSRLPFGISLSDNHTLLFSIMHFIGNHHVIYSWVEKWFYYYAKEIGLSVKEYPPVFEIMSPFNKILYRCLGMFWTIVYLISARSGAKKKGGETIDMTHEKKILPLNEGGFTSYSFSKDETQRIIGAAKSKGLSQTGIICYAFIQAFFDKFPDKNRICINYPQDIKKYFFGTTPFSVGNISGTIPFYIYRDEPINKQLFHLSRWIERGVPYGLMRLLSFFSFNQSILKDRISKERSVPFCQKEPLLDFTCTFSFNDVESDVMEQIASELVFIGAKSALPLILCTRFNGSLTIVFAFSKDMVLPEESLPIGETAIKYLKEMSLEVV
jgi:hypothetical protein